MERGVEPVTPVDGDRFRALFDEHFDELWSFARRRTTSAADADDVTAEIFAVAWRRREDLPAGVEARLWLFGVGRRILANHRRADGRDQRLRRRLSAVRSEPVRLDGDDGSGSVADALRALRDDDRELVLLRCWDGLSVTEIGTLLGCSPNAVSLRLHRVRRRLADRLTTTDPGADAHENLAPETREEPSHGRRR
jgi:RNA polymerase sigma-70 factor (ECF subfamily)